MNSLSNEQIDTFWRDGYLVVENAVEADVLSRLKSDFATWVEESRGQTENYGDTLDGRPRFTQSQSSGHPSRMSWSP